jgi:hypothetical protein
MRLIIQYSVGDGDTWWATEIVPVIHESPESFIVEFEEKCKKAYNNDDSTEFSVGGQEFNAHDFYEDGQYFGPSILTLDQFFEDVENEQS